MSDRARAARPTTPQPDVDTWETSSDDAAKNPFADVAESMSAAPASLEAATRLVDPMRLNNLTPDEITPSYLRRAIREVRRARRGLENLQHTSQRLLISTRKEALEGQQIARENPGQRRAKLAQASIRRIHELHVTYAALEDERSRFARRIAAGRDLAAAWNQSRSPQKRRGALFASQLRQMTLGMARLERVTRERLDELERALKHVNVAEEAMRRDGASLRLDPVNFTRFAGRGRWGVRLALLGIVAALVALVFPPWSPPAPRGAVLVPERSEHLRASPHDLGRAHRQFW